MSIRYLSGINVDSNTLVVDDANNRVGIGTASPTYTFDIVNTSSPTFRITRSGATDFRIGASILSSGALLGTYSNSPIQFLTNSTTQAVITEAGNVGIGITSPAEKLHTIGNIKIEQTSNTNAVLTLHPYSSALGTDYQWNLVGANSTQNYGFQIRQASTIYLHINNSANGDAGNVGIGTTSPSTKLHVVGDIKGAALQVYDGLGAGVTGVGAASAGGALRLYSNGAVGITLNTSGAVQLNDYGSGSNTGTATQRLAVDASGNVIEIPIGSGPVDGNGTANYVTKWSDSDTITNSQIFDNGTNVGIGTTSPGVLLDVNGKGGFNASGNFSATITDVSGDALYIRNTGAASSAGALGAGIIFTGVATANRRAAIVSVQSNSTTDADRAGLAFFTHPSSTASDPMVEAMRIVAEGNVGIGTSSPGYKLHVNGDTFFGGSSIASSNGQVLTINGTNHAYYAWSIANTRKAYAGFGSSGSTTFELINENTGGFIIGTNGGQQIIITSAGNVGVGTTSPGAKLQVIGNIGVGAGTYNGGIYANSSTSAIDPNWGFDIARTAGVADYSTRLKYYPTTGDSRKGGIYNSLSDTWVLYGDSNNTPNVIIPSGLVGIGTTSPATKLDISGDHVGSIGLLRLNSSASNISAQTYYIGGVYKAATYAATDNNFIIWGREGDITLNTTTSNTERVRITSTGNVGIGTTAPNSKLDVRGVIESGNGTIRTVVSYTGSGGVTGTITNHPYILYANNDERMRITSAGNVGIGTTSPSYKLQVNSDAGGYGIVNTNGTVIIGTYIEGSNNYASFGTQSNHGLGFFTNNAAPQMYINTSGNVGIGTTSPTGALHVIGSSGRSTKIYYDMFLYNTLYLTDSNYTAQGAIAATSGNLMLYSNGGAENMRITSAGNVGIGTTSPATKLHVDASGHALVVSNDTGNRRIYFGTGALGEPDIQATLSNGTARELSINAAGGNVGIGVVGPSQKLHVAGNVRVTGAYYDSNNEAGTSGQVLTSTGSGTDWKSLSEITGVDGTGTANYVAKWSDTDTITNSQIRDDGTTVGIGTAPSSAKLTVNGSAQLGSRAIYVKSYASLDTTGVAVAGLVASTNGDSSLFEFTCNGGAGQYQRIVYACHNTTGTWNSRKVIDEGTNELDVVASANAATITFTFKARTTGQQFTPRVTVEVTGSRDASYL